MQAWRPSSEIYTSQRIHHHSMRSRHHYLALQCSNILIHHLLLRLHPNRMHRKRTKVTLLPAEGQMNIHIFNDRSTRKQFSCSDELFNHAYYCIYYNTIQMLPHWLEEFQTLQQYLGSLYDSLEGGQVARIREGAKEPAVEVAVHLLTSYGRKIMELSEQSTFKHRNQHYLPRKEVEEDLAFIYKSVVGEETKDKYEQMVRKIIEKLQEERQSIWMKYSMPESRLVPASDSKQQKKEATLEEGNSNVRTSKTRSKTSKVSTVKEVLQIKNCFQEQENCIREFFNKLNKMMEAHKVPTSSLEPDTLKYSRRVDENNSEKIIDLIRTSTQAHCRNITNLTSMAELLHEHLQRKLKNEGLAESKLTMFMEEAQRMEEVYSYTLSKMLEKLSAAKQCLNDGDGSLCLTQLENLEEITRKLYGLYPSQESFKALTIKVRVNQGTKSYGVQVNTGKTQQQKKTGSEAFRLQVRVNECLQRFQRNTKFRKTFELKEIEKLFETVREILPVKTVKSEAEVAYQQEFKNLLEMQEKKEKQLVDSSTKKVKKAERKVQELEVALQQAKKQIGATNEEQQQQRKRLQKKLQTQQNQLRKLTKQKAQLDSNLSQYLVQIQKMREQVKKKGEEQSKVRRSLQRQCSELRQKCESSSKRLKQISEEYRVQKEKLSEQRKIYQSKIMLTENQLNQERELSAGFRVELQEAIKDNRKLREQLSEMSRIYEQKIRELDEMIENLRELHQIKQKQETRIQELEGSIQQSNGKIQNLQAQVQTLKDKNEELAKEKKRLAEEVQHWKQQGKLTDSDLKVLKDQVDKVSRAYIESQEQLELTKHQLSSVNQQRQKLFRERLRLNRLLQDLQSQSATLKTKLQATELSQRDMKEEYYQITQQHKRSQRESQDNKREIAKIRKELQQQREQRAKNEKELRQLRQENQGRREAESLEQGKRKMQLENLRVQLRKKSEQLQKQKETYEERLSLTMQKMKELQEFTGQKQLLSRLMQNHQTQ